MGEPSPLRITFNCTHFTVPTRNDPSKLDADPPKPPDGASRESLCERRVNCRPGAERHPPSASPRHRSCRYWSVESVQRRAPDATSPEVTPTIWDRLCGRAWSRAGAVAVVLASGPTRRVLGFSTRLVILAFGSFMISASVAVTLWTELGPGPLDVFIGAIRNITGVPLTFAVWAMAVAMVSVAWVLGRRPGPGTLLSPFMIGPMLESVVALLDRFDPPGSLIIRISLQLIAIMGIGVGAGALIVSGLGAGSGELFAGAASDRFSRSEPSVRFAIEMAWIGIGVALGGPAGLGTVMVAVLIGPAVSRGHGWVDAVTARSLQRVVDTHEAIIARELAASGRR